MLKTGTPVSVDIYYWVANFGESNKDLFDPAHDNYKLINSFLQSGNGLDEYSKDEKERICSFLKWVVIACLLHDGGMFCANLKSFQPVTNEIIIHWENGIHQKISLTGWDRQTRKAVDYILNRLISVENATTQVSQCFEPIVSFLSYQKDQLQQMLSVLQAVNQKNHQSISAAIIADPVLLFICLAALPKASLTSFYKGLSDILPNDLELGLESLPIGMKDYFDHIIDSDIVLIDKVKMHYNLVFCSTLEAQELSIINDYTTEKLNSELVTPKVMDSIHLQLNLLKDEQCTPRLDLLTLMIEHFKWPGQSSR